MTGVSWAGACVDDGEGDGKRKASWAGAAGIEVENTVSGLRRGLMGVAADDGGDACGLRGSGRGRERCARGRRGDRRVRSASVPGSCAQGPLVSMLPRMAVRGAICLRASRMAGLPTSPA